jgi:hypothetical protein
MLHLRLIVPTGLARQVLAMLREASEITNLWHLPGAAVEPAGDLISCDVAKEGASHVLRRLRDLGLEREGSIAVEAVDASVSDVARAAEIAAPGSPADAVVWEEVESRLSESAVLSVSFLLLITIATMIAAIGIITDSIVLISGRWWSGPSTVRSPGSASRSRRDGTGSRDVRSARWWSGSPSRSRSRPS